MKINKLFHWLYAGLMLLPFFAIFVPCIYVSFNPNAKDSYSSTKQINVVEVTSASNFIDNETYILQISRTDTITQTFTIGFYESTFDYSAITNRTDINKLTYNGNYLNGYVDNTQIFSIHKDEPQTDFYFKTNYFVMNLSLTNQNSTNFHFLKWENYVFNKLDNAFTYAVNQINENPLYSWAQSSFLVAPIAYITAIFGLASTSPIVTLLSYWLTISIVWLCFDLIMYIPLLVHRWLDKGILE